MKDFFGYGRSRSSTDSNVLTRHFNPYVNCLHTQVGSARENMEVYVAEFETMDIEPIGCAMRGRNPENPSQRGLSNGKYKQRIEMGSNISNTITSVQKDSLVAEPLLIPQATKQGYIEVPQGAVFDMSYPESTTRRGRVQEGGQVSPTLMAGGEAPCYFEGVSVHPNSHALEFKGQESIKQDAAPSLRATDYKAPHCVWEKSPSYRIRKLTPRECFRLMGVTETDIDKIQQSGVSQSQQYKMAGNSIVVDCLYHMFRKMFTETACESQQLSLF
jgi:DNA (cytosine-5)-methyltransferase 1